MARHGGGRVRREGVVGGPLEALLVDRVIERTPAQRVDQVGPPLLRGRRFGGSRLGLASFRAGLHVEQVDHLPADLRLGTFQALKVVGTDDLLEVLCQRVPNAHGVSLCIGCANERLGVGEPGDPG